MQQIQRQPAGNSIPSLYDIAPLVETARLSIEKAVLFALVCAFWGVILWMALISLA
jgi:hypothetical protein